MLLRPQLFKIGNYKYKELTQLLIVLKQYS